jgi:hypothetical protein
VKARARNHATHLPPPFFPEQMRNMSSSDWETAKQQMGSMDADTMARQAAAMGAQMEGQKKYALSVRGLFFSHAFQPRVCVGARRRRPAAPTLRRRAGRTPRWPADGGPSPGPPAALPALPQGSELLKREGNDLLKAGRLDEACAKYRRALSNLEPLGPAAEARELRRACALNLAQALLKMGSYEDAAGACSDVLKGAAGLAPGSGRGGAGRRRGAPRSGALAGARASACDHHASHVRRARMHKRQPFDLG